MKVVSIILFVLFFSYSCACQNKDSLLKHEIGIDITNTLSFLKKNSQSYLLNYRYHFSKKSALRAGLNLDISNDDASGIYPSVKLGYQRNQYLEKWNFYYGADLTYSYYKSTAIAVVTQRYGIGPLIGVQYHLSKRISLSTEASINYYQFTVRDKNSFDPEDNRNYWQLSIGSVGMFVISFHL